MPQRRSVPKALFGLEQGKVNRRHTAALQSFHFKDEKTVIRPLVVYSSGTDMIQQIENLI